MRPDAYTDSVAVHDIVRLNFEVSVLSLRVA